MDEDTAKWKEGVRVRSFMEAQKGKKILYFVKFFSRNKKINALTEVTENQFLTASGINSESNPFGNKPQEITAQNIPSSFPPLVSAFFFFFLNFSPALHYLNAWNRLRPVRRASAPKGYLFLASRT